MHPDCGDHRRQRRGRVRRGRGLYATGCRLGLIARGEERLRDATASLQGLDLPRVEVASVDVTEVPEVEAATDRFEQELGQVDVWINAAMTTVYSAFVEMSAAELERVTRVIYLGAVNDTRAGMILGAFFGASSRPGGGVMFVCRLDNCGEL